MNIDSLEEIKTLDAQNVLGSVGALPNQCLHAFEDASKVEIPEKYKDIHNIVMTGMGGSGLGARVIESVYSESLNFPLIRVNDYHLPGFANENTLVINSSYSGNTEEIVDTLKESIERKCKIMAISTGGEVLELSEKNNIPFYKIDPKHNPSKQPRMAIGYSIIGQLVLASKAGLFGLTEEDVLVMVEAMKNVQEKCEASVNREENDAKQMAKKILNKKIFLVASHHLVGATHVFNNQLNENSKTFTADFQIPELNHHLMEGLKNPKSNKDDVVFIFLDSNLYSEKIQKRMEITKDVVTKNKIENLTFSVKSPTKLSQNFELIQFGAYVNFYLSMLYGIDPAPIPWVDYFKEKLSS